MTPRILVVSRAASAVEAGQEHLGDGAVTEVGSSRPATDVDIADGPRGAGGGDGAGDVGRDGSVRELGTSNSSTTEWCTRRSIATAVALWSRKIRPHWLKTKLLVTIADRRS